MRSRSPMVSPGRVTRCRGLAVVHRASLWISPPRHRVPAAVHRARVPRERRRAPGRQAAHRVSLRGRRQQRSNRSDRVSSDGGWRRSHLSLPSHAHGGMGPAHRQLGDAQPNAGPASGRRPRVLRARGVPERVGAGGDPPVGAGASLYARMALGARHTDRSTHTCNCRRRAVRRSGRPGMEESIS